MIQNIKFHNDELIFDLFIMPGFALKIKTGLHEAPYRDMYILEIKIFYNMIFRTQLAWRTQNMLMKVLWKF